MGNSPKGAYGKRRSLEDDVSSSSEIMSPVQDVNYTSSSSRSAVKRQSDETSKSRRQAMFAMGPSVTEVASQLHSTKLSVPQPLKPSSSKPAENKIPTVFKWKGGGKSVKISGSFNNWGTKIPMVKSTNNFYTIIDLPEGEHKYKFIVDGSWKIDNSQPTAEFRGNDVNVITVTPSDFFVLAALDEDIAASANSSSLKQHATEQHRRRATSTSAAAAGDIRAARNRAVAALATGGQTQNSPTGFYPIPGSSSSGGGLANTGQITPPGAYSQDVPPVSSYFTQHGNSPSVGSGSSNREPSVPPMLPPQLLQAGLNKVTDPHSDPNLLPLPNHVMVNHLFALSIKDGVIVLSCITRYRKKYVTTLIYKPH
jgi:hypothetical protein